MKEARQRLVYLHGFNSSPASNKARLFAEYCQSCGIEDVLVPALPYDPARAMVLLENLVRESGTTLLVGSSLGGYYATWLAERYGLQAALINPAVSPCEYLGQAFLGKKRNPYTGEEYEFTTEHAGFLRTIDSAHISNPDNYLLLLQTGDEVLDHRHALALYAGCKQIVQEGGSHSFENFPAVLPAILQFAGLQ